MMKVEDIGKIELVNIKTILESFKISRTTLGRGMYNNDNPFPFFRLGRRIYFDNEDIVKGYEKNRHQGSG